MSSAADCKSPDGLWRKSVMVEKGKHQFTVAGKFWHGMQSRCDPDGAEQRRNAWYAGCVCDFASFQEFATWAQLQIGYSMGAHMDKDFLAFPGVRRYAEDTCVFVPAAVNTLLVSCRALRGNLPIGVTWDAVNLKYRAKVRANGRYQHLGRFVTAEAAFSAYKVAKESEILRVAYIHQADIDPRVFQALLAYRVKISD